MTTEEADIAYEVWRRGGDPDRVTGDEIERIRSRGFDPTPEDFIPRGKVLDSQEEE